MVPVCSMTRSSVIGGDEGSRPISFSVTTTWAELDTGKSSVRPCTIASTMTFSSDIHFHPRSCAGLPRKRRHLNRGRGEITHLVTRCAYVGNDERNFAGWF